MKKFKGFTLIESLVVIFIIGVISVAIYNMRTLGQDHIDYRKEAVNVMYKEIAEMLKDFQRNKIWKDYQGNEHEIDTFQIKMVGSGDEEAGKLEIGYTYLYCIKNENLENEAIVQCYNSTGGMSADSLVGSGYYESKTLISSERNYTAQKNIKNIDKYLFKSSGETTIINIYKDGNFEVGYDYLDNFRETISDIYTLEQTPTQTTAGGHGEFDDDACARKRNECLDLLCPTYGGHHNRWYNREHCKRSKMKGITPQSMAVLQTRRHHGWRGFREERQSYRGIGGVGNRKKMDGCLQKKGYNDNGCSASQRWTRDGSVGEGTETINYTEFTPEANEITNFFPFFIYATEKNGEQCNTTEGIGGKERQPIGKITINTITKTAIVERCNNDRVTNGIDCGQRICE